MNDVVHFEVNGKKSFFFLLFYLFTLLPLQAQYNTDHLVTIGRSALYFEDYVLSIRYFNQAISAKPYLYEPWFYRGVAKYYLDDFSGAEGDCTEAIQRNPYVVNLYELRGLARIQQNKFSEAIEDYSKALKYDPENRGFWNNRVLCRIQDKDYDKALAELDTIQKRWSQFAKAWNMRADIYMQMKDTTKAVEALDRSLVLDPYDGQTWAAKSIISLTREEWDSAEVQLDHAIHLMPRHAGCYINRALARVNRNNLRGAMSDYDMALDMEPNNFLGHYNRGLLRAQVGDDNRAITDFDFVLRLEPDNMLALFNRAVLLDKTGDLNGAIRDYSKVIAQYPNFWTGLEYRAACYRRLGMKKQAEADEFTVYKARLYKHLYGTQPRLDPSQIRKRSDEDVEKYNQLVMEDDQEPEHEYAHDYRGRVQDRKVDENLMPMFVLSFEPQQSEVRSHHAYDKQVEQLNEKNHMRAIFISNTSVHLGERDTRVYFAYVDSLTAVVNRAQTTQKAVSALFYRAIAYAQLQDYNYAVDDLTTYLYEDSTSVLALWQRAACQWRINQFLLSEGENVELKNVSVREDIDKALTYNPQNAYLLYNRGTMEASLGNYSDAVSDFSNALEFEPYLAEAYFNRGLCHLFLKHEAQAINDLSKAGELGVYQAYSLIKKNRK